MALFLLLLFIFLQVTDGIFTFHGVIKNIGYEANPILAYSMRRFGLVETLVVVKLLASLCGYFLYKLCNDGRAYLMLIIAVVIYSINFVWHIIIFSLHGWH